MTLQSDFLLDESGWRLIGALQKNARISFRMLGKLIGLSAPAVSERVRRMEEAGIIRGYHADIDLEKVGLPILAFIRLSIPRELRGYILEWIRTTPEVLECYRVAGIDSFLIKVCAPSIQHLEGLLDQLGHYGTSTTSVVLSTTMVRAGIPQIEQVEDFPKSGL